MRVRGTGTGTVDVDGVGSRPSDSVHPPQALGVTQLHLGQDQDHQILDAHRLLTNLAKEEAYCYNLQNRRLVVACFLLNK